MLMYRKTCTMSSLYSIGRRYMTIKAPTDLISMSNKNGVTTMRMERPDKLNAWTQDMMKAMVSSFNVAAKDSNTKVVIFTGSGKYFCAGVDLSAMMRPMHPEKLFKMIVTSNKGLFDTFINFPKPLLIAVNGPAIGASVTSATLADAIVAADTATFSTPFAALGITPEGCSSIHFERIMGKSNAQRMLGTEGWRPTAAEAKNAGFVADVVTGSELQERAQALAEKWIQDKKVRSVIADGIQNELRLINARESNDLAHAFMGLPFLEAQYKFAVAKGKKKAEKMFWWLIQLRPIWRQFAPSKNN